MNRTEIVEFVKSLIEEAIDEAEDNGTSNPSFVPNCNQALEFIESVRRKKKEYSLERLDEQHCRDGERCGAVYMPWQINIKISDWLTQPVKVCRSAEEALDYMQGLEKENPYWD